MARSVYENHFAPSRWFEKQHKESERERGKHGGALGENQHRMGVTEAAWEATEYLSLALFILFQHSLAVWYNGGGGVQTGSTNKIISTSV